MYIFTQEGNHFLCNKTKNGSDSRVCTVVMYKRSDHSHETNMILHKRYSLITVIFEERNIFYRIFRKKNLETGDK